MVGDDKLEQPILGKDPIDVDSPAATAVTAAESMGSHVLSTGCVLYVLHVAVDEVLNIF